MIWLWISIVVTTVAIVALIVHVLVALLTPDGERRG